MRKDDCIFCKIANGEIPSTTLYENEDFRVIFDVAPASKGHALVLPKNHFDNVYDKNKPILPQIEAFRDKYDVEFNQGWKVELAKSAKLMLKNKKKSDINDVIEAWGELFEKLNN